MNSLGRRFNQERYSCAENLALGTVAQPPAVQLDFKGLTEYQHIQLVRKVKL